MSLKPGHEDCETCPQCGLTNCPDCDTDGRACPGIHPPSTGRIIGVSNQGGIALGHLTLADVGAAMTETHRQTGRLFDKIAWCSHYPSADHPEMARCWCRKPSPGLIIESALVASRGSPRDLPAVHGAHGR